jgi:hypothetical protein
MDLGSRRVVLAVVAIVLVVAAGVVYVASVARETSPVPVASADGELMFVALADGRSRVEQVRLADPAARGATEMTCQRVYRAGGTTVCLRLAGPGPTYAAEVSKDGAVVKTVPLPGVPSRAKVSASGHVVTWTSFVTGDSYAVPGGFSTRTGFLDLRTGEAGEAVESLEGFTALVDGQLHTAQDVNYWGLTVAQDDRTFYATLASGGYTWLVKGDLVERRLESLRRDAECPSLSPDGTKVAYKKRIGRLGPWELAVLDLKTGEERRLPGTAGVDDQATWLDDNRLAFAAVPRDAKLASIHVVPADGSAAAVILIPDAASPSPV